ncbi:MAG: amino acid ABC transporter permease [Clostridia bacterium]|nr:amino acid ABC transporter permease [Clostridia bacterium]
METFLNVTLDLLSGFGTTLKLFALTLVFALPLGLIFSFFSMSKFKPLSAAMKLLIWVIRGTPLMLQIIVVFYGPGLIFGLDGLDRFPAVLIAFVLNYACYFSEIYRGGIESIPKGQYEAGQVLGMTKSQIFFKVVLLQVIKRVIPPMSNEIITLVKDTSLARIIAVYEVIWSAQVYIKSEGLIWPLFYTGAFYLIFNGLLTIVFRKLEKKLDYFKG